jgi:hypothetical protein
VTFAENCNCRAQYSPIVDDDAVGAMIEVLRLQ